MWATAALSGNRIRLGVGVGWCEEEFDQTGQDFSNRGKRLDEMIPALRALWQDGWVEYHGHYYDVPACQMNPAPTEPVPILGGGHSPLALRRAATLCDGWIAAGAYARPRGMDPSRQLEALARRAGATSRSSSTSRWPSGPTRTSTAVRGRRRDRHGLRPLDVRQPAPGSPDEILAARIGACEWFAEHIIAKLAVTGRAERDSEVQVAMKDMKIGLQLGYWGSGPPPDAAELVVRRPTASDTTRSGLRRPPGRTPSPRSPGGGPGHTDVRLGDHALPVVCPDADRHGHGRDDDGPPSGGRFILGLGVSGPAGGRGMVRPPSRSRWPVPASTSPSSARCWPAKAPVTNPGPHYPLPYPGGTGLGKPLKSIVHPLRADIPIILGAEGPKNVALAAEIADGWFPIFSLPGPWAFEAASWTRASPGPGPGARADDFEVLAFAPTVWATTSRRRPTLPSISALYIGGMGAKDMNFHFDVFCPMGFEEAATKIQDALSRRPQGEQPRRCPQPWSRTSPWWDCWLKSSVVTSRHGASPSPPRCS